MVSPAEFLQDVPDGLSVRQSNPYAFDKLGLVYAYMDITGTAMRAKWLHRCYLDLQAGPGKNQIGDRIVLGSPLIALTAKDPFSQFFLNELDAVDNKALRTRVEASPLASRVAIYQEDVNEVVDTMCGELPNGGKSSLNVAFLDPEGLELHWSTVERLARVARMDLIINFSTGGIRRLIDNSAYAPKLSAFFGTDEWAEIYAKNSRGRYMRGLVDLYLGRLQSFGYTVKTRESDSVSEVSFKNSKNVEVYWLVYASKHPLGDRFWNEAIRCTQKLRQQPRLL